jgi:hypothetical protein
MANAFKNMAFIWHRFFHEKQYNKICIFLSNIFHCLCGLEQIIEKIVEIGEILHLFLVTITS